MKERLALISGIIASFLVSVCCLGPVALEKCDLRSRRINRILFCVLAGFAIFGAVSQYITALHQ